MTDNKFERSLQAVADSSFYHTIVIDGDSGVYDDDVRNVPSYIYTDEYATWTYDGGVEFHGPEPVDHSGLMEPYEVFYRAGHIRYWLPEAVAALEAGHLVEFNYCIVRCGKSECAAGVGHCDYCDDGIVGWILVAHVTD